MGPPGWEPACTPVVRENNRPECGKTSGPSRCNSKSGAVPEGPAPFGWVAERRGLVQSAGRPRPACPWQASATSRRDRRERKSCCPVKTRFLLTSAAKATTCCSGLPRVLFRLPPQFGGWGASGLPEGATPSPIAVPARPRSGQAEPVSKCRGRTQPKAREGITVLREGTQAPSDRAEAPKPHQKPLRIGHTQAVLALSALVLGVILAPLKAIVTTMVSKILVE